MIQILHGDCVEVLASLPADSFAACVTDPPYHLTNVAYDFKKTGSGNDRSPNVIRSKGFMNQAWDGGDIAFRPETWAAVLRVLKPGAYLAAFASARRYHRMVCAIEDAGFVIHPMVGWIFASGFPKASSVSKAIDRAAGAEREVIGLHPYADRRPNGAWTGTVYGYEGTDGPGTTLTAPATEAARQWKGWYYGLQSLKPALEPICLAQKPFDRRPWVVDLTPEVLASWEEKQRDHV